MRISTRTLSCAAAVLVLASYGYSGAASAACTRLAFSVNDYGKDGPTKDAKRLLDTYIAKWTAERGISKYITGKKEVTCELFLNLILFDEHTCKAEASVCWDGAAARSGTAESADAAKDAAKSKAVVKSTPVKAESDDDETAKAASEDATIETGSTDKVPETITAKPESSEPTVAPSTPESDDIGDSDASDQAGDQGGSDQP